MDSEKKSSDLIKKIHDSVVAFKEETCAQLCMEALNEGIDPYDAITAVKEAERLFRKVA